MHLPVSRLRRVCAHRSARTLPRDDDDEEDDEALVTQRALCVHSLVHTEPSHSLPLSLINTVAFMNPL